MTRACVPPPPTNRGDLPAKANELADQIDALLLDEVRWADREVLRRAYLVCPRS
jgi:hypothetical protein